MNCIKCGRETDEASVFCRECLAGMDKNPVKPGTPVVIPKRPKKTATYAVKKERPEDQIAKLQKQIKVLVGFCLVLILSLSVSIGVIVHHFVSTDHNAPAIGQNYSTEAPDDAPHLR